MVQGTLLRAATPLPPSSTSPLTSRLLARCAGAPGSPATIGVTDEAPPRRCHLRALSRLLLAPSTTGAGRTAGECRAGADRLDAVAAARGGPHPHRCRDRLCHRVVAQRRVPRL